MLNGSECISAQYAVTGTFHGTFYASDKEQLDRVTALASAVTPELVAKTAIYCRVSTHNGQTTRNQELALRAAASAIVSTTPAGTGCCGPNRVRSRGSQHRLPPYSEEPREILGSQTVQLTRIDFSVLILICGLQELSGDRIESISDRVLQLIRTDGTVMVDVPAPNECVHVD